MTGAARPIDREGLAAPTTTAAVIRLLTVAIKAMYSSLSEIGAADLRRPRGHPIMHTHDTTTGPTLDGQVRAWLRLEGLAALIAGAVMYGRLGGDWLWFVPALLAVDISMAGYLRGPVAGAFGYNLFHNWATGLIVLGLGLAGSVPLVAMIGAVLAAHVGMDRAAGYGLKLATSFQDTHLGRIGKSGATASSTATALVG